MSTSLVSGFGIAWFLDNILVATPLQEIALSLSYHSPSINCDMQCFVCVFFPGVATQRAIRPLFLASVFSTILP